MQLWGCASAHTGSAGEPSILSKIFGAMLKLNRTVTNLFPRECPSLKQEREQDKDSPQDHGA